MRNLDECRAEVFARSEKRIAKRRKIRRRVTAGLAPLCFCLILLAVLPMMSNQKNYECMPEENVNGECAGEPAYGYTDTTGKQATVISSDGECWPLSESRTKQLAQLLDSYLNDGKPAENQKKADYEIEIPAPDGSPIRYLLSSRHLTRDGLTAQLTESEQRHILELLQPVSE